MLAQRARDLLGHGDRPREHDALGLLAVLGLGQHLAEVLLGLDAEAAQLAQAPVLDRSPQRVERVDADLVVEPARPLGPEARQVHDRDEADRDLGPQLDRGRDVAGLVERQQLLLERLADVRQLGDLAVARERGHRHRGVAHRARRVAVGDHAVLDRAVELVEVGQLVERGGDLCVGEVGHGTRRLIAWGHVPMTQGDEGRRARGRPGLDGHAARTRALAPPPRARARARGRSARSPSRFALLFAVWVVASLTEPDPSGAFFPGVSYPADDRRLRLRALPQRPRAGAARARLRRRLHGRLVAADGRPSEYTGLWRKVHETRRPAGDRFRDPRHRASRSARRRTRSVRGTSDLAGELGRARRCCCSSACSRTRCPELTALFLPLAAWTIASRRGAWQDLLAATFVTVAIAVPVLVAAAAVETWVSPAPCWSLSRGRPSLYFLKRHREHSDEELEPTMAGNLKQRHRHHLPGGGPRVRQARARRLLGRVVRTVPRHRPDPRGDRRRPRRPPRS